MRTGILEHVNLTVTDPGKTAEMLSVLFDWKIRWKGPSSLGGFTVHVGADSSYLALYTPTKDMKQGPSKDLSVGGLNHIGVVVGDLDAVEARVIKAGFEPNNYGDYEPGRRFYFYDDNGIEFEVVSYT
ncbi:VOC family protein [Kordiimonas aquimaris]|uniref:VOC family protein n=1 Tax=Kordiimonas aquimaris TaxID=707591 RepID=UPI0021CF5506|nr:VOC family protein [Kordiimonas aquimaris]